MISPLDSWTFLSLTLELSVARRTCWQWSLLERVFFFVEGSLDLRNIFDFRWSLQGSLRSLEALSGSRFNWLTSNSIGAESADLFLEVLILLGHVFHQLESLCNFSAGLGLLSLFLLSSLFSLLLVLELFLLDFILLLLDGMGSSEPLGLNVLLNVFVEGEEEHLEGSLGLEHVQNLEVFFVESGFDGVLVIAELT